VYPVSMYVIAEAHVLDNTNYSDHCELKVSITLQHSHQRCTNQ
jgi:hypothetical protein